MTSALAGLPDYLRPGLDVVFVGINPGMISARAGRFYANPRNAFWRCLHLAGLTPVLLTPAEDHRILTFGHGLTDIVKRPSSGVRDLRAQEFRHGRSLLEKKVLRHSPRVVCFNGKTAFVGFFGTGPFRGFGRQCLRIGPSRVYVVPSTSPANARFPFEAKLRSFVALKAWLDELRQRHPSCP